MITEKLNPVRQKQAFNDFYVEMGVAEKALNMPRGAILREAQTSRGRPLPYVIGADGKNYVSAVDLINVCSKNFPTQLSYARLSLAVQEKPV